MKVYRVSPSLLGAFDRWLNAADLWQRLWGACEAPKITADEFERDFKRELIAYINREPQEHNELADRGTCLNELIDRLNGRTFVPQMEVKQSDCVYVARMNGFEFPFNKDFVDSLALMLSTAIPQAHVESTYDLQKLDGTPYKVQLHGFCDFVFPYCIWDLKTTSRYECEKYAEGWQRHVYPVAAVDGGLLFDCERFTYYALEMRCDGGVLIGKPYVESYDVNLDESRAKCLEAINNVVVPLLDQWMDEGLIPNQNAIRNEI